MEPSTRIRLVAGGDALEIDAQAGGRLASFVAAGRERLVTTPPSGQATPETRWGVFVMAPWAGRIRDAGFDWQGSRARLAAKDGPHALHGLVTDRPWEVVHHDERTAELRCDLPDAPWPFTGAAIAHRLDLQAGRLRQQIRVVAGATPMPAAAGWHPWFRRPDDGDMTVTLPADTQLELDADGIPTGAQQPVAGDSDLRDGPALGDRRLDHVYVRPGGGAVVAWPDLRLEMSFGPTVSAAVVHTPPEGVCVEPQSAWPDAANLEAAAETQTGLAHLQPGEELVVLVDWHWTAAR